MPRPTSPASCSPPRPSRSSTRRPSCTTTSWTTPTPGAEAPRPTAGSRDLHRERGWSGDAAAFGDSSALLLGDLLLGWSDELFDRGTGMLASREHGLAGRAEFNRMRTEVTAGQYLDILEEASWRRIPRPRRSPGPIGSSSTSRRSTASRRRSRSARRSAVRPRRSSRRCARSGCRSASPSSCATTCSACSATPRSPASPPGDDLREGKRTVLIALARAKLPDPRARRRRRAARRPRAWTASRWTCCGPPSATAAPSTRSSGSSPTTSGSRAPRWMPPRSAARRASSSCQLAETVTRSASR